MRCSHSRMSEFLKRKLRTYFNLKDFDKDGIQTKDNWEQLAITFAENENADKERAKDIRTRFLNVWDQYAKFAVDKNRLTREEFVDSILKQRYDPELMKREDIMIRCFFDMMDFNSDGYLQEDEHKRLFDHLGVPDTSWTKDTFLAIDTNGDGKLSFQEFINGYFDYCYSEDENSPYKNFFGPFAG